LSQNQPFLDGNKRTAAATMLVFLDINGYTFEPSDDEIAERFEALAEHRLDRRAFSAWVQQHGQPLG
jgi:death-on-curing protein